jgi:hypothetical protein
VKKTTVGLELQKGVTGGVFIGEKYCVMCKNYSDDSFSNSCLISWNSVGFEERKMKSGLVTSGDKSS